MSPILYQRVQQLQNRNKEFEKELVHSERDRHQLICLSAAALATLFTAEEMVRKLKKEVKTSNEREAHWRNKYNELRKKLPSSGIDDQVQLAVLREKGTIAQLKERIERAKEEGDQELERGLWAQLQGAKKRLELAEGGEVTRA